MKTTPTILEKLSAPLARVGEGLAAGAALVAQAVLHFSISDTRKEFLDLQEAGHDDLIDFKKAWGKKTLRRTLDFLKETR